MFLSWKKEKKQRADPPPTQLLYWLSVDLSPLLSRMVDLNRFGWAESKAHDVTVENLWLITDSFSIVRTVFKNPNNRVLQFGEHTSIKSHSTRREDLDSEKPAGKLENLLLRSVAVSTLKSSGYCWSYILHKHKFYSIKINVVTMPLLVLCTVGVLAQPCRHNFIYKRLTEWNTQGAPGCIYTHTAALIKPALNLGYRLGGQVKRGGT